MKSLKYMWRITHTLLSPDHVHLMTFDQEMEESDEETMTNNH